MPTLTGPSHPTTQRFPLGSLTSSSTFPQFIRRYNSQSKKRLFCEPGKHFVRISATGTGTCLKCEAGKYQKQAGQLKCVKCKDGYTSDPNGTTTGPPIGIQASIVSEFAERVTMVGMVNILQC